MNIMRRLTILLCMMAWLTSLAQKQKTIEFFLSGTSQAAFDLEQVDSIVWLHNQVTPSDTVLADSDAIDLGLSVCWASHNIGAEKPQDYGYYLSWGESAPKDIYNDYTYFYGGELANTDITATDYDPARKLWGSGWRMPTYDECRELADACTWEWCNTEGVNGMRVTGPNGNSIFLPAGGFPNAGGWNRVGTYGTYWTGTNASSYTACYFRFDSGMHDVTDWDGAKYVGQLVRPVRAKR